MSLVSNFQNELHKPKFALIWSYLNCVLHVLLENEFCIQRQTVQNHVKGWLLFKEINQIFQEWSRYLIKRITIHRPILSPYFIKWYAINFVQNLFSVSLYCSKLHRSFLSFLFSFWSWMNNLWQIFTVISICTSSWSSYRVVKYH